MDTHTYRTVACGNCATQFSFPVYCGDRFCDVCNGARKRRVRHKVTSIIRGRPHLPGYRLKMLTLTAPNSDTVAAGAAGIVRAFRRLRQRAWFKNLCAGGFYAVEATGCPGKWHVHLHVICDSKYISQKKLSKQFKKAGGGSIVWVRNIKNAGAVSYCLKYVFKAPLGSNYNAAISEGLRGVRLFQPFGSWHNIAAKIPPLRFRCPSCNCDRWVYLSEPEDFRILRKYGVESPRNKSDRNRWDRARSTLHEV